MELIYFSRNENRDLYPILVGHWACPSLNKFGPHIRDYNIVHFVLNGKGSLFNKRGSHPVNPGEFFVIRQGEETYYVADKDEPWEYAWLGFSGERVTIFDNCPDVIKTPSEIDMKLMEYIMREEKSADIYTSILYELIYNIFTAGAEEPEDERIRHIHQFIKYNYMENITISGISSSFGIERSYLYRIFKKRYGISPKEYLTNTRLKKAHWLLERGYSVAETAYMVGFSDAFTFYRAYKKHYGVSPSQDKLK